MTQEQIEQYEVLREARHDVETVLQAMEDDSFDCLGIALKAFP